MGDVVPFAPRQKPSRRRLKGQPSATAGLSWLEAFRQTRPFLLLIALLTLSFHSLTSTSSLASSSPTGGAEIVEGTFSPCGRFADSLCVVDGDTFRINERRVRVVGIDTAERNARCEAEADLAARSTIALTEWLNRGHFMMTPNPARPVDRYGRELQVVTRLGADGRVDALADWMRAEGGAREYGGGTRGGWC